MGQLKADIEAAGFELIETHISWVFLGPEDVYKVKRALDLGFLDFRTTESRRKACHDEVRLNRRLAPDVYLGVVPITRADSGEHTIGGEGQVVDWAVHMRRLRDERRADAMLGAGALTHEHVDSLAEHGRFRGCAV